MSLATAIRRRCSVLTSPAELVVEHEGRKIAVLSEPHVEDQFWFRWRITPLVDDVPVSSNEFWNQSEFERIAFRCKASNAVVQSAFWAVSEPIRDGRLVLRGAYIPYEVRFLEHPLLWLFLLLFGGRPTA